MIKRYKCVVVANGLFPTGQQALELLRQAEFVVACDGAVIGLENGRLPDAVVGDLDSLPEPVRNRYSDRIHRVKDQETNDLTKAVNYVKTLGFRDCLLYTSPDFCIRTSLSDRKKASPVLVGSDIERSYRQGVYRYPGRRCQGVGIPYFL